MVYWLDAIPLWVLYVAIVVCGMATIELGDFIGRQWTKRSKAARKEGVDSLVAAILALLAFLLVFMAGLANNRFDTRRQLVITEANTIDTLYRRADFLDEPQRSEVRALLRQYVDSRVQAIAAPAALAQERARGEAIQEKLWQYAADLGRAASESTTAPLFIDAVNRVIEVHTQRMAAIYNRFPASNWVAILTVALLSLLIVGYSDGLNDGRADGRGQVAELVLVIVFAAVMMLIVDLDRAGEGLINVSQQSMIDLQQKVRIVQ